MKLPFKERRWIFVLLTPLAIIWAVGNYFLSSIQELTFLEDRMKETHLQAIQYRKKKKQEEKILHSLSKATKPFSEKELEKTLFLEAEVKKLQVVSSQDEGSKKRLRFLSEGGNQLKFTSEKSRSTHQLKETELKQKYPVEMNEKDLKKILNLIEHNESEGFSCQLIIKKFELEKKAVPLEDETVYLVQCDLIKRELSQ